MVGGAERYYFGISTLLRKKGHKVAHFAMEDKKNRPSLWSKYFVSHISLDKFFLNNSARVFRRMLFSLEAKEKIGRLLDDFEPDIVHVHNIYAHISPSILPAIKKRNIPIVYTVHDYHLIHPNVVMFHNGGICEITKGRKFLKTILHKCIDNSYIFTVAPAVIWQIHNILNIYDNNVNVFISPSGFLKRKLVENGYDSKKIIVLPNFVEPKPDSFKTTNRKQKPFVLYFGRLSKHKGIMFVLEAARNLTNIEFKIAGGGKEKKQYISKAAQMKLKNVQFLGHVGTSGLNKLISNSLFCVIPSLWYENMPYSVMEAFALGKPVIASKIGGIPELVKDGKNGLLFEPGNVEDFNEKILTLWSNPERIKRMGEYARIYIEKNFNSDSHYKKLMKIYEKAIFLNEKVK